jgi:hypothetical protein
LERDGREGEHADESEHAHHTREPPQTCHVASRRTPVAPILEGAS